MGRWTIVNVVLGLMVALLGFEIARTWAQKLPPVEVPPPAAQPAPDREPHEKGGKRGATDKSRAQQTPAALVAAIAEKDLFDPSRRPPAPEEVKAEVVPVTKPPENVTVVGVRIFGKDREVFVTDGSQPPPVSRRLRIGDQVAGFTIKGIDPHGIALTSPSGDSVDLPLTLDKGKGQGQPGHPPAPGRPGMPARAAAQPPQSPAAGPQGTSPAAGVLVRPNAPPAIPPPPAPPRPAPGAQPPPQPPQQPGQQLPSEVRQKLEQLRQNDKRPGRRR